MPKIIVFAGSDFTGASSEFRGNDSNLTLNGKNVDVGSMFVVDGNWTLYDTEGPSGVAVSVSPTGGPDADGVYRDYADWTGVGIFNVKAIAHA